MRSTIAPLWRSLILFSLLQSCAILFPDRTAPKSSSYKVDPPLSPWVKFVPHQNPSENEAMKADLAFENPKTGAIISLNSLCRKYTKDNLDTLTNNLVRGIENKKLISKSDTQVAGSKALDTVFEGEVDNVALKIRTVVVTKDDCTFDFIYVSVPKWESESRPAFDSFLTSFQTE